MIYLLILFAEHSFFLLGHNCTYTHFSGSFNSKLVKIDNPEIKKLLVRKVKVNHKTTKKAICNDWAVPVMNVSVSNMSLPLPCWTAGTGLLGLKASAFRRKTYSWSLRCNSTIFVQSDHMIKALSWCSFTDFSRSLLCLFWSNSFSLTRCPLSPGRCR